MKNLIRLRKANEKAEQNYEKAVKKRNEAENRVTKIENALYVAKAALEKRKNAVSVRNSHEAETLQELNAAVKVYVERNNKKYGTSEFYARKADEVHEMMRQYSRYVELKESIAN